jgi:hypothetical protein
MAIESANIIHDIPMAVNIKERFTIKWSEEGTISEADIMFNERGMAKWAE